MLITDIRHETPAFPFFWSADTRQWRAVSLTLRQPYFFVSYSCNEDDFRIFQSTLIANDIDLLNFCTEVNDNALQEIHQVAVLLPDKEKGVGSWRMLPVKKVWSGMVGTDGVTAAVLMGIDGEKISGSRFIGDVDQVELVDIKYQLKNPTNK